MAIALTLNITPPLTDWSNEVEHMAIVLTLNIYIPLDRLAKCCLAHGYLTDS